MERETVNEVVAVRSRVPTAGAASFNDEQRAIAETWVSVVWWEISARRWKGRDGKTVAKWKM